MECLGIVRIKILQPIVPTIRMEVILLLWVLSQPLYLFSAYPIAQNRKKSFAVMEGRRSLIDSEPSPWADAFRINSATSSAEISSKNSFLASGHTSQ